MGSLGRAAVREGICWFCPRETHSLLGDMEFARRTARSFFCIWMIASIAAAFPQSPKKFSSVLVTEVDNVDPETKRAFGNGARSILYSSLPEFSLDLSNFEEGDIIGEIAVEVETPPLRVTKPKDPEGKLREKAEAREASERRRPSSNFFLQRPDIAR